MIEAAHQFTLHAARRKQSGERSDLEAGMAKLFASEVALECARRQNEARTPWDGTQPIASG